MHLEGYYRGVVGVLEGELSRRRDAAGPERLVYWPSSCADVALDITLKEEMRWACAPPRELPAATAV